MTLLRDLIDIPDRVHKGDFVLKLTEGVLDPEATLSHYVVTEQLADAFDRALQLIESAVTSRASKASYLHGSFGSGKSHFMAVLYLLLRQEPAARAITELAPVVHRHDAWLAGKRFLLVPFHLIGARNLEAAILGGYAKHLRTLHPEDPGPAVYVADAILDNADQLRAKMGDESFFAALGKAGTGGGDGGDGWGDLESNWDAEAYEQARQEVPESKDQRNLVEDLLRTFFSSYQVQADASGAGFVTMDAGLSELARHAAGLGYQGVVLFLDELILWLASRAGQPAFVEQQIEALVKLVEAERADRPIPIVSFVARQRDLRKLIGDHMPGADRLRYVDKLDHYEGRFGTITLENRNLHKIVEKRILVPRDEGAQARLDEAFETSVRARPEVVDTLMASHDRATFRQVYPFSPALVDALVGVSSVLQRERTALKLLSELLVSRRDSLKVGDLVPVGDLWDVLVAGDEPFTEEMRIVFEQAKKLWRTKLRPMLEDRHRLSAGEVPAEGHAYFGDARLLQTVLLAALAPEATELRALTVGRLVALNHGSIRSPIPGQETQLAVAKLREWVALGAGEIRLGEGANPTVDLELTGVDVDSILERVRAEDNQGNRARKVRELLFRAMEIADEDHLFHSRQLLFKGTPRTVDVVFGNVRELADDAFEASGERWKLVLDFPFDSEGFTPADDLARLEGLRQVAEDNQTLCWLPSFFSRKGQAELGRLVLIDFLLTGERFTQNASHLPPTDRQAARALLRNQQTQLRARLQQALEVAYGLRDGADPLIDRGLGLDQHLQSLTPTLKPRPPAAASFKEAFEQLAAQALEHQHPAHPDLGPDEVRKGDLKKVHDAVAQVLEQPDRRARIEDPRLRALLKRIADPLRLGSMHEAHFEAADSWVDHFERAAGRDEGAINVGKLRRWIDQPKSMGLPEAVQDVVILIFAARTHRTFVLHGGPVAPAFPQRLTDEMVLEAQEMPSAEDWQQACTRAADLFGVQPLSSMLTANNLADLVGKLRGVAADLRPDCERLAAAVARRCEDLELGDVQRLRTAREAVGLLGRIEGAGGSVGVVRRLAAFRPSPSTEAVARSMAHAGEVRQELETSETWRLFESVLRLEDERKSAASQLRSDLSEVFRRDELARAAAPRLRELRAKAVELLASPSGPGPGPPVVEPPAPGWSQQASGGGVFTDAEAIAGALEELRRAVENPAEGERRLELHWSLSIRPGEGDSG